MTVKLEVSTVNRCDNGCLYCPSINKALPTKSRVQYMTLEDAKRYFSKIPRPAEIYFGGHSDPMRAPEIYEIVKYLTEEGFFVFILTTLHRVDKVIVRKVFSLPGIHARLHLADANGYTKIQLSPELIRNYEMAIRLIQARDGEITACCWGDLPIELHHLKNAFSEPIANDTRMLCDFGGNIKHPWTEPYYISGPIKCRREHMCMHMLPDGRLSVCETDWALNHIVGDLNSQTYEEVLNGDAIQQYAKTLLSDNVDCVCRHCTDAVSV